MAALCVKLRHLTVEMQLIHRFKWGKARSLTHMVALCVKLRHLTVEMQLIHRFKEQSTEVSR
jgi:hypothetical protein